MNDEIWTIEETLEELHRFAGHFAPAIEDDNNFYRGGCDIDGKDAAVIGMMCQNAIRLLADRAATVAEPDAVERVAKAMYDLNPMTSTFRSLEDGSFEYTGEKPVTWEGLLEGHREERRRMARVAIAAMQSGEDDNWLDDALAELTTDGLPGTAVSIYRHDGEWGAQKMTTYLEEPDSPTDICGHGATAREAILDAVQKAKEARGE